jgi:hypothetical protein
MLNKKLLSAAVQAAVGPSTDPNFNQTVLLLHGDGTNGAQNNTFIAANAAAATAPGGFSGYFDGSGDFLTVPDSAAWDFGTGDFTVESFVNFSTVGSGNYCVVSNYQNATTGWALMYRPGFNPSAPLIFVYGDTTLVDFNWSPTAGTWYHVAVSRSGSTLRLFVDGTQVSSVSNSTNISGSSNALHIGRPSPSITNQDYFGYVSNLRIVKGTAVYTSAFTPPTGNLTAITNTQLLTCQSATFVDNSSNNFTITVNGNTTVATATNSGLPITRNGNTTQGTFSPFSLAAGEWSNYFSSVNDYFGFSDITLGANFTVEFFVYFNSAPTSLNVVISNAPSGGTSWIGIDGTNVTLSYGGNNRTFALNPVGGTWYYIQLINSSSSLTCYANGSQIGTAQTGPSSSFVLNRVGGYPSVGLVAYLSNIRVVSSALSASSTPTTPLTAVTNTQLLACQSNRFVDNDTTALTLTVAGSLRVTAFSPFAPTAAYDAGTNGASGYFDGTGDYLSVASATALNLATGAFTIETWVYLVGGTFAYVASRRTAATARGFVFYYDYSTKKFVFLAGDTNTASWEVNITSTNSYDIGQWVHVAVTRNSSNDFTIWVNGTSQATANSSVTIADDAGTLLIGAVDSGTNSHSGYFSNWRLVKDAVYTSNFTPPTAPLTAITNTSLLLNFTNAGIIDSTGKNVLETVGNAQIDTTTKKFGTGSMEFDGSGDVCVSPRSDNYAFGTGDFTVEFWVRLNSVSGTSTAAGVWAGNNNYGWLVQLTSTTLVFAYANNGGPSGGTVYAPSTTFSTNTWYHIAVTRSGSNLYLFRDGVQIGTTQTITANITSPNDLWVGANKDGNQQYMNGFIDDLRITKGVARYTDNFTPPTAPFEDQ